MLKNKLFLVPWLLTATVSVQTINPKQETIQQRVESMFATLSVVDTIALKGFLTANVRINENGEVWTTDRFIQKVLPVKSIPDFKRINWV